MDDFTDERVRDPRYLELAAKVRCVGDPACDAIFPNQFPAVLRIRTNDGGLLEERVLANRGGPGNPLSVSELRAKFMVNAGRRLKEATAQALGDAIERLEERPFRELLALAGT